MWAYSLMVFFILSCSSHCFILTHSLPISANIVSSNPTHVCQWLATGWWFSQGIPVSCSNKTEIKIKQTVHD
jgi:hypothetical protein